MIMGGALSDGGGLYHWLKENLRLGKDDDVEAEIAKRAAGRPRPDVPALPRRRTQHRLSRKCTRRSSWAADLDRCDRHRSGRARIRRLSVRRNIRPTERVAAFAKSSLPAAPCANRRSGRRSSPTFSAAKLSLPDTHEASSRGAVLLALETIGKIENIEKISTPKGDRVYAGQNAAADLSRGSKTT